MSTERVAELLGVRLERVSRSLAVPRRDRRIVSVTKGAWAPVRPGWRRMGTGPPAEYIDDLMAYLGHRHYVAYRSAAAVYGVSHHSFRGLQVVVDAYCRDRWIGGVPLRFVRSSRVGSVPTRLERFGTAQVTVSTPETTVLDLMERPDLGGGLGYVANAIGDMLAFGLLDAEALAAVSGLYARSVVQRAGYVLDRMQHDLGWAIDKPLDLGPLEDAVACRGMRTVALAAERATRQPQTIGETPVDRRWQVAADFEVKAAINRIGVDVGFSGFAAKMGRANSACSMRGCGVLSATEQPCRSSWTSNWAQGLAGVPSDASTPMLRPRIVQLLKARPKSSYAEIAQSLEASPSYVAEIARREGLTRGAKRRASPKRKRA